MNVLKINVSKKKYKKEKSKDFGVMSYSINYNLKNKTYKNPVISPKNPLIISTGPFMGLKISGTHRLIITGRSPQTSTFFLSTLGAGSIELSKTGINTLVIEGKSKTKQILIIKNIKGKFEVLFKPIKKIPSSVYDFQEILIKKYGKLFKNTKFRSLVVGRSAIKTNMGAILSINIRNNKLDYGSEGWAGRGGMGSQLLQCHNIAAIMFGGDYEFEKKFEPASLFEKVFKKSMMDKIFEATEKYRYIDKIKTGGTYGANFFYENDRTLWFNWESVKLDKKTRQKLYDKFIKNHYLKQFNKDIILKKSFKTCGETCSAVCKKVRGKRKRDYEPSIACGPQCGIFDIKDVEIIVNAIEDYGFDAIEMGNIVSFVFEVVSKKLIDKKKFLMKSIPTMNQKTGFSKSKINSKLGAKLVNGIGSGKLNIFNKGLRVASKELKLNDYAIYAGFGKNGVVSPNVYWVPGFLIPLPIQGKFHTYYKKDFNPPFKLGKMSAERGIKELFSEECGVCRFHRGWSEELIPILAKKLGFKKDFYKHCKKIFKDMIKYNKLAKAEPVFFESLKTKEFIKYYVLDAGDNIWKKKFESDLNKAISEYWIQLNKGIEEVKK